MPSTPRHARVHIANRRAKAIELALSGVDNLTIARALSAWPEHTADPLPWGYGWFRKQKGQEPPSENTMIAEVSKDLARALELRRRDLDRDVAEYRRFHLARLDRLLAAVWRKALQGDAQAARVAKDLLREHAKILGLYAPTRVRFTEEGADRDIALAAAEIAKAVDEALAPHGPASTEPAITIDDSEMPL